jgi:hypothetical protein
MYAKKMALFLSYMTEQMHMKKPGSLVIWYDSVKTNGELKWQNELNEHNKLFLDACDGIFLNYFWKPEMIEKSVTYAGDRRYDVFAGVDVWGRGSYGGGKYDTHVALQKIVENDFSIAIFAPAWTLESLGDRKPENEEHLMNKFLKNEELFWIGHMETELLVNSKIPSLEGWNILENGGNGWSIIDDGFAGHKAFITSHKYCKKSQKVDVSNVDCSKAFQLSVWYCGVGPNYNDEFYVKIELRNEYEEPISFFDSGIVIASKDWKQISYILPMHDRVKYLYYEHGGKDAETWAGHFGVKISCASVTVTGQKVPCAATYIEERSVPSNQLCTNFNVGMGKNYYLKGNVKRSGVWNDNRLQQVLPTFNNVKRTNIGNNELNMSITLEQAYSGGSCLLVEGAWIPFTIFRLFATNLEIVATNSMLVSITTLSHNLYNVAYLIFILDDGSTMVCLSEGLTSLRSVRALSHTSSVVLAIPQNIQLEKGGWKTEQFTVPDVLRGRTIIEVQLCCECVKEQAVAEIGDLYVGEIKIVDTAHVEPVACIQGFKSELCWNSKSLEDGEVDVYDVILTWDQVQQPYYYYIYLDKELVGIGSTNMYTITQVPFKKLQSIHVQVIPVSETLHFGDAVSCNLSAL